MLIIANHIIFFFQISLICISLSVSGFLLKKIFLNFENETNQAFEENGLFGFILIGFLALTLNFFFPLNLFINNMFFILIFILGYQFNFFDQKISKLLTKIFVVSIIAYFFLIYANNNRPDAFLYHLPYSRIVNENKIIFGLTNLHSRFGHISIFQYISSFFVNSFFSTKGLLIPISLVPSFFFIYCFKRFNEQLTNIDTRLNAYLIFLFLIISIYSFSRYSGWGNDAQAHIFYFLTIIYFLDYRLDRNNLNLFFKISITVIFTFLVKPFYLVSLIIPIIFFFNKNTKIYIIKSKSTFFLILFLCLWILKNFIVSSCFIYPINFTCVESTTWYNNNIKIIHSSAEAWSKDWINRDDESLDHETFNKDFNWVKTWSKNHLNKIFEKIIPVIIFILLNICLFYFTKCLKKDSKIRNNNFFLLLLLINFIGLVIWFLKFPIFRFGLSYIYSFLIFVFYFLYIRYLDLNKIIRLKKIFLLIIFVSFIGLFLKNAKRIYYTENTSIYPIVIEQNLESEIIKFRNKYGDFIYYKSDKGSLCGYIKSPCFHAKKEVIKDNYFGYIAFIDIKD